MNNGCLPPRIEELLARQRCKLEAAFCEQVDNGPTLQEESGATDPQGDAPSASAPHVAPAITDEDEEDSDADADDPFSVTDLVNVLDPATLDALMGSCGASTPAWTKLRKTFPAGKGMLGFLHFTGLLKRDIDTAKIAELPNKLRVNEAFSGAATLATYALASLLYDPRLGEINNGPAGMGLDIICMLICALIQEHGKQRAVINRCISKAIPGYQILVDMAETTEENGSNCLTAEQHQQYIQYKNDSHLANAI
ncbi:hypothetical protein H4S07_002039, partial [Coemansia furcata]